MVAGQPVRQGGGSQYPPGLAKKKNLKPLLEDKPKARSQRGMGELSATTDPQAGRSPWAVAGGEGLVVG